jgi:hypothetical protein
MGCYVLSTSALFELKDLDVGSWPELPAQVDGLTVGFREYFM